jgi:hypothetical protein
MLGTSLRFRGVELLHRVDDFDAARIERSTAGEIYSQCLHRSVLRVFSSLIGAACLTIRDDDQSGT